MYTQFAHKNKQIMKTNTNNIKKKIHLSLKYSLLNNQGKRAKKNKKTNLITHNQGVPGSCPGGPTPEYQELTIIFVSSFFIPLHTICIQLFFSNIFWALNERISKQKKLIQYILCQCSFIP